MFKPMASFWKFPTDSIRDLHVIKRQGWTLIGLFLLGVSLVSLGWLFRGAFRVVQVPLVVQEKMLTVHDDLFAIGMSDKGKGWVVGKYGLILFTEDGGKSWNQQSTETTKALTAVSFADDRHGFVAGGGGVILATADGGVTWKPQASGSQDHLLSVHAVSPDRAYAVGAFGTLLSTVDAGLRWRRHKLSWEKLIPRIVQEIGYMEPNLNTVYFTSPEIGWVGGEFGLILHTRDGGETWITQRYGAGLSQIVSLEFADERSGWAIGQRGTLLRTMDGGRGWTRIPLEMEKDLYAISLSGKLGIIVGEGVILETRDGGHSWISAASFPESLWLSGVAMKSNEAIAVGSSGAINHISLDGDSGDGGKRMP